MTELPEVPRPEMGEHYEAYWRRLIDWLEEVRRILNEKLNKADNGK